MNKELESRDRANTPNLNIIFTQNKYCISNITLYFSLNLIKFLSQLHSLPELAFIVNYNQPNN